jgi:hypothetical protein
MMVERARRLLATEVPRRGGPTHGRRLWIASARPLLDFPRLRGAVARSQGRHRGRHGTRIRGMFDTGDTFPKPAGLQGFRLCA